MRIALVNMPFGFHIYPSIQLGTLSTLLKTHGWQVKSFHLLLKFAHEIELPVYNRLCEERFLVGEWLFSELLFGDAPKNREYPVRYAAHLRRICESVGRPADFLTSVKTRLAPQFLQWAAEAFDWEAYGVVGFTSTFNQNLASLTLAKLIKEKHPGVQILFGGSNFESEMGLEYFRVFPWIDYVVPGEAEPVLPGLLEAIGQGTDIPKGVAHRRGGEVIYESGHSIFTAFDKYGVPDYDDYFEQLEQIDPASPLLDNPIILYETARGCWWGEKHHCTFCGLNAFTMKFRCKSMEQVHAEIACLSKRYDTFRFRIVDNILEMKYIDGVFGKFARENYDLEFFLEVKSNLTGKQIKTLARGGATVIQPGIESFSANQLLEMDKGVRPMQNILCLKLALYYGIEVTWNILTGFPGETDEDYRRQIDIIKSLIHLQPPLGVGTLWLERFSPYFTRPGDYGITITGPGEAYEYVYDSADIELMKVAYDYEFATTGGVDAQLAEELRQVVEEWRRRHQSEQTPFLLFTKSVDFVTVYDGRPQGAPTKTRYEGAAACVISFCNESPRTTAQIRAHIEEATGKNADPGELETTLADLRRRRILFEERGKHLTLALAHNAHL